MACCMPEFISNCDKLGYTLPSFRHRHWQPDIISADKFQLNYYPAPGWGTGYCFRAISLFLCQQHYGKTAGSICMKFSVKVWSDHGTTWLNFGSIRVNGSGGQRSICLLSLAIAQRTSVNKSVSFARWQQGAGFVVSRTTACYLCTACVLSSSLGSQVDTAADNVLWLLWP